MASLFSNTYAHRYAWAGLRVQSKLILPDLLATLALQSDTPDLRIGGRMAQTEAELASLRDPCWHDLRRDEVQIHRQHLATATICSNHITVLTHPDADIEELHTFLCKVALPTLGQLRSMLPLHASAVATPRGAALFVGPARAGKTTLATCLHSLGAPIIADDPCMLWSDEGRVMTAPSISSPRSVSSELAAYVPKEAIPARPTRARTSFDQRRVSNIFILCGPDPKLPVGASPMSTADGLAGLARHRFDPEALDHPSPPCNELPFFRARKDFDRVSFWSLNLPTELSQIPALARDLIRMVIGASTRTVNPPTPVFAPISRAS